MYISGYCLISGVSFSPSKLEAQTEFRLREKIEPQQIGRSGRYKGVPSPFGSAIIDFERMDGSSDMLTVDPQVADLLAKKRDLLSALGVSDITVHFNVEYRGQCNLELTPETLLALSTLGVPIGITCYENKE